MAGRSVAGGVAQVRPVAEGPVPGAKGRDTGKRAHLCLLATARRQARWLSGWFVRISLLACRAAGCPVSVPSVCAKAAGGPKEAIVGRRESQSVRP